MLLRMSWGNRAFVFEDFFSYLALKIGGFAFRFMVSAAKNCLSGTRPRLNYDATAGECKQDFGTTSDNNKVTTYSMIEIPTSLHSSE